MKRLYYPAIFTKWKEGSGYTVEFLDFPEAITEGDNLEEAYFMAQDALYLAVLDYETLPEPTTTYMNLDLSKYFNEYNIPEESFVSLVELDRDYHNKRMSKKVVNTTVTMPEWLKLEAENKKLSFSKLLQNAIKEELAK